MIGNVINTISTKISLALLAVAMLLINSNVLGTEGLGTIGIIILEITIYLLLSDIVCGGPLTYFVSRKSFNSLFLAGYGWIFATAILFHILVYFLPIFSVAYADKILLLGFLQSCITANISLLTGQQRFKTLNLISLSQTVLQIIILCSLYFIWNERTVESFLQSTLIAYIFGFVFSFIRLIPKFEKTWKPPSIKLYKELIHYGFYLQIANITQLMNYRLNYFLLDYYSGRASVGKYMAGIQLSEGLLLPSKSIGKVQYAKISSNNSKRKAARLSITLMKLVLLVTIPAIVVMVLIPVDIYTAILTAEFDQTPMVILMLSVGIAALAGEMILSGYFSGTGQQKVNATSSSIGLVVTLIAGFSLIPFYGLYGAAACASLSYLSNFIFLLYKITQSGHVKSSDFLITKSDFIYFKRVIRKVIHS